LLLQQQSGCLWETDKGRHHPVLLLLVLVLEQMVLGQWWASAVQQFL
jgi:hypothetical protein